MNGISIVIISRGREQLLENLIKSVKKAEEKIDFPTEIILVDSSIGNSIKYIKELVKKYNVKYFYQDICVSAKRNYGAKQAEYDVILFLDSDCIVCENILCEYKKIYDKYPEAAGSAGPLEFVGKSTWFWNVVEKTPYTIFFSMPKWSEQLQWSPTANFSVKKEIFMGIGGFDTEFQKNPGGEDVDLGLRMYKNGLKLYSAQKAVVYHSKTTWCSVKSMFRRAFNYGLGDMNLAIRHNDMLCHCLPRRTIMMLWGMLLCIVLGIVLNPLFYIGILGVPVFEIIFTALLVNIFAKYKSTTLIKQIVVQFLLLTNELGYIYGCIRKGKYRLLNKQLIYFKPQIDGICYQNFLSAMIYCLFLMIIVILIGGANNV